jgi:pyruvate dehydrogenase E2 component (dihydrolipoamide acetyltransferase)
MDVLMPQLGETVAEGKISAWFKAVGERVNAGDNLFEVETDKTAMEVPVTAAGIVAEIRVGAGETVPVGTVVAVIADSAGAIVSGAKSSPRVIATAPVAQSPGLGTVTPAVPAAAQPTPRASTPFDPFREVRTPKRNYGPARLTNGIAVTPLARRLAVEAGIDPATISGSGPHGRIVARDVESAHPRPSGTSLTAKPATTSTAAFAIQPVTPARSAFSTAIAHAKRTVPHFHVHRDVSLDSLLTLIEEINAMADGRFRVTVADCVIKALALALQKFPAANASWSDDVMLRYRQCDIAVVVPTADGVAMPVIRATEAKGLAAIAADAAAFHESARGGLLRSEDLAGGAAAVWDLSAHAIRSFAPIVLPPKVTALAIGAPGKRPFVDGERMRIATQMTLTLACDHRVIDGVLGAQLLGACVRALEHPLTLIL